MEYEERVVQAMTRQYPMLLTNLKMYTGFNNAKSTDNSGEICFEYKSDRLD